MCVYLDAIAVSSLQPLYDSGHRVLVSFGDVKAEILDQLVLLIYVHKIGSYVSVRLVRRGESHLHTVHFLWDDRDDDVLRRVFGFWGQT